MKVALGSDHRGIEQRKAMVNAIESAGHEPVDLGTFSTDPCDYPDIAAQVARCVAAGDADCGVLTCGTGIGVSIAANKVHGIRAAVCHDERTTRLGRKHNDANVLCMPADTLDGNEMASLVLVFLSEEFEGGRHARRVDKIMALETVQAE